MSNPLNNPPQGDTPRERGSYSSIALVVTVVLGSLSLCFFVSPILRMLAMYGWQDVYWEQCFPSSAQHRASNYNHFCIKNDSVVKTPRLTFTFVVDVSKKNILRGNGQNIERLEKTVCDPNSSYVSAIDGCGNDIKLKPNNEGSTRVWVEYEEGLKKKDDTKIALYWDNNKKQVKFDKRQLYKGTPNTKDEDKIIYSAASERKWHIKHLGKLIIFGFVIVLLALYQKVRNKENLILKVKQLVNSSNDLSQRVELLENSWISPMADEALKARVAVTKITPEEKEKLQREVTNVDYKPELEEQLAGKTGPDIQSSQGPVVKTPINEISNKKKKSKKKKSQKEEESKEE